MGEAVSVLVSEFLPRCLLPPGILPPREAGRRLAVLPCCQSTPARRVIYGELTRRRRHCLVRRSAWCLGPPLRCAGRKAASVARVAAWRSHLFETRPGSGIPRIRMGRCSDVPESGGRHLSGACAETSFGQSSSSGSSTSVPVEYQFRSCNDQWQRGHRCSRWRASRTATHSSFSRRRSSACCRSLGCSAWVVQVAPSSSPRQMNSSAPSASQPSTAKVTAHRGTPRHDVPLAGCGAVAEFHRDMPCSENPCRIELGRRRRRAVVEDVQPCKHSARPARMRRNRIPTYT